MTASDTTTRVVSESGSDVGPGHRLREAREAAQLTVAEVASRMRLKPHALEQLENDNYERLHGPTFVRGYLSGYARLLGLPERPILEAYERQGYGPPALVSELGRKFLGGIDLGQLIERRRVREVAERQDQVSVHVNEGVPSGT